jgi:ATP-binding cassette subfamily B protein
MLTLVTVVDATIAASGPLVLQAVIDDGILPRRVGLVAVLSLVIVGLAVVDAVALLCQAWYSGRVGEGLVYDLRTKVFDHVQRQSLAFFTRTQTGALVSRLNTDIVGARQAVATLLSQTVSTLLTLALVLGTMFYLSWQITVAALVVIPVLLLPSKLIGRRLQRLTRAGMQLDAEMGTLMNERFDVSGATTAQLYGRPADELALFASKAARRRDLTISIGVYGRLLFIIITFLTAVTSALVYGLGGVLAIHGTLPIGTLVAMVALLLRLYGPVNQLSSMQVTVMTALVSFDRVFEVLDLQPLVVDRPHARELSVIGTDSSAGPAPTIEFDHVSFRHPTAAQVSLASLEMIARQRPEQTAGDDWILRDVGFTAPAGRLTALVGPSGAGKTTITQLVTRLYDPGAGTVRVGGEDVRDLTLESLRATVGVVTQDVHLFHDTIRANLLYARPAATERELVEACEAARIWDLVHSLADGLDTVVGDRGHRLSGGEKQRLALARLLVKSPPIVVLDEATAHLDSESEAAVQEAMRTALAGRTSLVIAHRLSTVREADQILVIASGAVRERGSHEELLSQGGLYADLYRTQFVLRSSPAPAVTAVQPSRSGG